MTIQTITYDYFKHDSVSFKKIDDIKEEKEMEELKKQYVINN